MMTLICVMIFIAVMAVRPAPAAELSRKMLGSWCGQWGYQFHSAVDDESGYWWRIEDVEDCGNRGGVRVRKRGYDYYRFGPQGSCKLTAIKFCRHGKAWTLTFSFPQMRREKSQKKQRQRQKRVRRLVTYIQSA
jgi:hypothetical protein